MYSCPTETKQQTAPFARAQHSPIYQAINKYDDRPKLPSQYYDGMQNSLSNNKPQRCEDKITPYAGGQRIDAVRLPSTP
ncbi:hypothetical protein OSTOST_06868 [Ostertagia ostertagi]